MSRRSVERHVAEGSKTRIIDRRRYHVLSVLFVVFFIASMLFMVSGLPEFASPDNPADNEVAEKYLEDSIEDTGAVNAVAGMILDYRAFDTLGESCVLYAATICVMLLLSRTRQTYVKEAAGYLPADQIDLRKEKNPLADDAILTVTLRFLIPIILLYGICVVLNGHLSPGGGFSGGAVISGALILYACAHGELEAENMLGRKLYMTLTCAALGTYCVLKGAIFFMAANHIEDHIPKGIPGSLLSGGVIPLLNICVGIVVACTIYGIYLMFMRGGFEK
ncbi:MAG: hypothetical protein IKR93_05855 [Firmicutes bacterium]|jgi:multicomponent Na+:H+ antiporter subunit B|nr:hypothetical protein [Bacillota bacterium]